MSAATLQERFAGVAAEAAAEAARLDDLFPAGGMSPELRAMFARSPVDPAHFTAGIEGAAKIAVESATEIADSQDDSPPKTAPNNDSAAEPLQEPAGSDAGATSDADAKSDAGAGPTLEERMAAAAAAAAAAHGTGSALIAEFNSKYAILGAQKASTIMKINSDASPYGDPYVFMSPGALRDLFLHRNVRSQVGKKSITTNVVDIWRQHPDARRYEDGIMFDPSNERAKPSHFNAWSGLAVSPKKGNWSRMHRHIHDIVCAGDSPSYEFMRRTMARSVQEPWMCAEIAVVMRGLEGVGKGLLAAEMGRIFGRHAMYVTQEGQVVGQFNGHLHNKVFIFIDEAFFAGNPRHGKILKTLITAEGGPFEFKGFGIFQDRYHYHVWMASNETWVVPASLNDRRMFVLDVLPTKKGDFPYFKSIVDEMNNGGREAMLFDLMQVDLTRFNHRDIPKTAGLRLQQLQSLTAEQAWWYLCLDRGYVFVSKEGRQDYFQQWHDFITTDILFASYAEATRVVGRRVESRETLGMFLATQGEKKRRRGVISEQRKPAYGQADLIEQNDARGYAFDNLALARAKFTTATGLNFI